MLDTHDFSRATCPNIASQCCMVGQHWEVQFGHMGVQAWIQPAGACAQCFNGVLASGARRDQLQQATWDAQDCSLGVRLGLLLGRWCVRPVPWSWANGQSGVGRQLH